MMPEKIPTPDLLTNCRQRLKKLRHLLDQPELDDDLRRQLHWSLTRQCYRLAILHMMNRLESQMGDEFDPALSSKLDAHRCSLSL